MVSELRQVRLQVGLHADQELVTAQLEEPVEIDTCWRQHTIVGVYVHNIASPSTALYTRCKLSVPTHLRLRCSAARR